MRQNNTRYFKQWTAIGGQVSEYGIRRLAPARLRLDDWFVGASGEQTLSVMTIPSHVLQQRNQGGRVQFVDSHLTTC